MTSLQRFKKHVWNLFGIRSPRRRRCASLTRQLDRLEERVLLSATDGLSEIKELTPAQVDTRVRTRVATVSDDRYENNDTFATAKFLGSQTAPKNYADLVLNDDDWFKFSITRTGSPASFVQIGFLDSLGDVDMELRSSTGSLLRSSTSVSNSEYITLNGLSAGTYYLRVYGYQGATNPSYDLSIAGPSGKNYSHTLFLNFDGAAISRSDLLSWENGEWYPGMLSTFDADANGISVNPFLSGRSDREAVIAGVLQNLNTDLRAFGMQAVRHFGTAVATQQTTTIFLGQSTLTSGVHIACDIDYGNINRTDIAFVGHDGADSSYTTAQRITAYSDVALHEAGHTFGLYHVASPSGVTETMGLRYNTPQSGWLKNTSFMNRTFGFYSTHGPDGGGLQNSAEYMKNVFISNVRYLPGTTSYAPSENLTDLMCVVDDDHGDGHDHDHEEVAAPLLLDEQIYQAIASGSIISANSAGRGTVGVVDASTNQDLWLHLVN